MILKAIRPEWRDHLVLLLLGGLALSALWTWMMPLKYALSNDSVGYMQEAFHFLRGEGLLRSAGWSDTGTAAVAFPLYPPGYSLAIAAFASLGLTLAAAARAVSWLAWLLLLPAIAFAVRPLVGRWASITIAVLAASSPGFYEWAYPALSDAAMVLFSVLALGVLIRCQPGAPDWRLLVLSGVLAGIAYWLRNAAAVLPLALVAWLGGLLLMRQIGWGAAIRAGLAWGTGFALLALPLFAYNWAAFGSIQPYLSAHAGTDFGVVNALRLSLWSQWLDLFAWRGIADLAWNARMGLAVMLPLGFWLAWAGRHRWRHASPAARSAAWLLALYAAIGFAMIVWGRSTFDWVELTLTRQLMPYSWAFLALLVWSVRLPPASARMRLALIGAFGLLMIGRLLFIASDLQRERDIERAVRNTPHYAAAAARVPGAVLTQRIKLDLASNRSLLADLATLPESARILSNFGAVLSAETGRAVRSFEATPDNLAALPALRAQLPGTPVVLVLATTNAQARQAQVWQQAVLHGLSGPVRVTMRTPDLLVVHLP